MKYNEKHKCWVSKEGVLFTLRGTTNQFGYHGDYGLQVVAAHPWSTGGKYLYYKSEGLHRIVWTTFNGEIPEGYEIDHINRDVTDNRLENLRLVTHKENCKNRKNKHTDVTKSKMREAALDRWSKFTDDKINEIRNNMKLGCSKRIYKKRGPYKKHVKEVNNA